MKNLIKVFGIIALVAVIGFSMAACSDDEDDGSGGGGGGAGGGSGGTFTITNIPAEYNGMYVGATLYAQGGKTIDGFQTSDGPGKGGNTGPSISNGKVSIPLWDINYSALSYEKYTGSDTFYDVTVRFYKAQNLRSDVQIGAVHFDSVKFSNGNATVSWSEMNSPSWWD